MEVAAGATLLIVGFAAEVTEVQLTDLVQPGEITTVRIPVRLPPRAAEGRKVVRVRVGEAGPEGELGRVLDEEFFTGRLRVEVSRPPRVEEVPPDSTPENHQEGDDAST